MRMLASVFLFIAVVNVTASAQQMTKPEEPNPLIAITVQVLDGDSGKPITSDAVSVRCSFEWTSQGAVSAYGAEVGHRSHAVCDGFHL
jgi:hypothetical protein